MIYSNGYYYITSDSDGFANNFIFKINATTLESDYERPSYIGYMIALEKAIYLVTESNLYIYDINFKLVKTVAYTQSISDKTVSYARILDDSRIQLIAQSTSGTSASYCVAIVNVNTGAITIGEDHSTTKPASKGTLLLRDVTLSQNGNLYSDNYQTLMFSDNLEMSVYDKRDSTYIYTSVSLTIDSNYDVYDLYINGELQENNKKYESIVRTETLTVKIVPKSSDFVISSITSGLGTVSDNTVEYTLNTLTLEDEINVIIKDDSKVKFDLYINNSENSKVDKDLTLIGTIDGTLRGSCDIINPVILIDYDKVIDFNYIYINKFRRYYYVVDAVVDVRGLWQITLKVDVLKSYKSQIFVQRAFVDRNETIYNSKIEDSIIPIQYNYDTKDISIGTHSNMELPINSDSNNSVQIPEGSRYAIITFSTIGNRDVTLTFNTLNTATVITGTDTKVYHITGGNTLELKLINADVSISSTEPFTATFSKLVDFTVNSDSDTSEVITYTSNIKYVGEMPNYPDVGPLPKLNSSNSSYSLANNTFKVYDSLSVFWETYNNSTARNFILSYLKYPYIVNANYKATENTAVDLTLGEKKIDKCIDPARIPVERMLIGRYKFNPYFNNYLDYNPYTKIELFLPYYGWISLDNNLVMNKTVYIYYSIDYCSDISTIEIINSDNKLIANYKCQLGISIPISGDNYYEISRQRQNALLNLGIGLISSTATVAGGIASANPLVAVGGELGAVKSITSFVNTINTSYVQAQGVIGSGPEGTFLPSVPYIRISRIVPTTTPENIKQYTGLPLKEVKYLFELMGTGMTVISSIHLHNMGLITKYETDEIEKLMKEGIIL